MRVLGGLWAADNPLKRTDPFLEKPEDWIVVGSLAAALLVGAFVIYLVDRWRKQAALRERQPGGELTGYRAMYERGELTEDEYAKVRRRVADRVKQAAPAGGSAAPPDTAPPPAPPTPPEG